MKIFISWSGKLSHEIACVFRDWLPSVIQSVKPYVSSEDIDKGTRWSTDIAGELEVSNYGIIIVTKDNLTAQWINFEAGALSKTLDKANVSPFLFGIKRSEVQGPLVQFQSTIFEKMDVFKLIQSINKRLDEDKKLDETQLSKAFEVWWNELETKLNFLENAVAKTTEQPSETPMDNQAVILEEILELVRTQQRILSTPENLLPKTYFEKVMLGFNENDITFVSRLLRKHRELWILLNRMTLEVEELTPQDNSDIADKVQTTLKQLLFEIENLGRELVDFERQKNAKIRASRIIPEF